MTSPRRRAALFTLAIVVLCAAVLFLTCQNASQERPDGSHDASPEEATSSTPGAPRSPRARAAAPATTKATAEAPSTAAPTPVPSHVPASVLFGSAAPREPQGTIRVTVRLDDAPVAGVDIWVVREPEDGPAPDGPPPAPRFSDAAYFGIPLHVALRRQTGLPGDHAALSSEFGAPTTRTGSDGVAYATVAAGVRHRVLAASSSQKIWAAPVHDVVATEGATTDVRLTVQRMLPLAGRCLGAEGQPAGACWVQAFDPIGNRPVSPLVVTGDDGIFALDVEPGVRACWVRASPARSEGAALPICATEGELPPIETDATFDSAVPGGSPITIRLGRAEVVVLDVTSPLPFVDLTVESLAWDEEARAWGRLGGPSYRRLVNSAPRRRAIVPGAKLTDHGPVRRSEMDPSWRRGFVALTAQDAQGPVKVWSWSATYTVIDPRGKSRVEVALPTRRAISVTGDGWKPRDRIRVVAFFSPAGTEMPVIWIDGDDVTDRKLWTRADAPPVPFEFQLVREGKVIGRSARVPASASDAQTVRIDVER
jgi:hypothetical protein